ncbi:MAG: hypothetical protein ABWY20_03580 [Mycobacterium sp.]
MVLDPGFVMHGEASDFLRALHGPSVRPHDPCLCRTGGELPAWCVDYGVEWSSISLSGLARFKHFVEATPHRGGWLCSGTTGNAILTAVCEFLRFCARIGVIEQAVADRLAEPPGTVATNM